MASDDEKPARFGCLDAARWAVAAAVTAAILVVIAYAVQAVLRPGELMLSIAGGHVSVVRNTSTQDILQLPFTLHAANPSGRVRIYYTGIMCTFSGGINGSTKATTDFLQFNIPNISVEQQSLVDSIARPYVTNNVKTMPPGYFKWLFASRAISNAILRLNGTRTVENYSGHNMTGEPGTIYYCSALTVGSDDPEGSAADVQCNEHLPAASG
jgi:hypothetical protein